MSDQTALKCNSFDTPGSASQGHGRPMKSGGSWRVAEVRQFEMSKPEGPNKYFKMYRNCLLHGTV